MHPAMNRNTPPTDNQHRGLDKATVGNDDGTGEAESNSTAVKVARGPLSGRGVEVGIRDKTVPGVGESILVTVALGWGVPAGVEVNGPVGVGTAVATGVAVGVIIVSLVAVAVAVSVGVTVVTGSAISVAVAVLVRVGIAVGGTVGLGIIVGVLIGAGAATVTVPPSIDAD